jgi:hypothetical protein
MKNNEKAVKIFAAIKDAQLKLSGNLTRGFSMAHIFQHAHVSRGQTQHELQKSGTWEILTDVELAGIVSDFRFDAKAEMIFSVRQLVAFKLILDKNPVAAKASDDMKAAAAFADKLLGLSKMKIIESEKKSTAGSYSGKDYSAKK